MIPLDLLCISDKNRAALQRDMGQIDKMRVAHERGQRMAPIVVARRTHGGFDAIDGRHRVLAAELAEVHEIEAQVKGE